MKNNKKDGFGRPVTDNRFKPASPWNIKGWFKAFLFLCFVFGVFTVVAVYVVPWFQEDSRTRSTFNRQKKEQKWRIIIQIGDELEEIIVSNFECGCESVLCGNKYPSGECHGFNDGKEIVFREDAIKLREQVE